GAVANPELAAMDAVVGLEEGLAAELSEPARERAEVAGPNVLDEHCVTPAPRWEQSQRDTERHDCQRQTYAATLRNSNACGARHCDLCWNPGPPPLPFPACQRSCGMSRRPRIPADAPVSSVPCARRGSPCPSGGEARA